MRHNYTAEGPDAATVAAALDLDDGLATAVEDAIGYAGIGDGPFAVSVTTDADDVEGAWLTISVRALDPAQYDESVTAAAQVAEDHARVRAEQAAAAEEGESESKVDA